MHLSSRNGRDWSAEFVAITAAIIAMPVTRIVLDGEAVAHCNALLGRSGCATACLYAFDLLHLGVDDLRPLELGDRARSCEPSSGSRRGRTCSGSAMGLEGIVSSSRWRLVVTPALCFWQTRAANRAAGAVSVADLR